MPTVRLSAGCSLIGADDCTGLVFTEGADGRRLTSDNHVTSLRLQASPTTRTLFNDTIVNGLGTLELAGLTAVGQVQILARDAVRSEHIIMNSLYIEQADTR